ncbi:hypothetical protein ACLOJK_021063 [Asimina triloba]
MHCRYIQFGAPSEHLLQYSIVTTMGDSHDCRSTTFRRVTTGRSDPGKMTATSVAP